MPLDMDIGEALGSAPESDPISSLLENIFTVDSPDGLEYDLADEAVIGDLTEKEPDFYRNLAEEMDEDELTSISLDLLESIEKDIESRKEWELSYTKGIKYLGLKVEESKDFPFMHSCAAFDPTLSIARLRFYATARPELFPASGPATYKTYGSKKADNFNRGEKVSSFLNHYLTTVDRVYYPDSDRLLSYLPIVGSSVRKVYTDPLTNYPIARFIDPQDFIVNNECTSLLSSDRLTHRQKLTKKTIKLRQMNGFYRNIPLGSADDMEEQEDYTTQVIKSIEGISNVDESKDSLYTVYEVHADLDLNGFKRENGIKESDTTGVPLPYVVSICLHNRKVLSLRRNWVKSDRTYTRIECFVLYNYLPGLGIMGVGLSQLMGSNAIVLTSIIRQLIDAATLRNFPGGLIKKGIKMDQNDYAIGPSSFWPIDTQGLAIQDVVMLMPYQEPSVVLKDLRNELIEQTQILASTAETQISESKPDAPVGTTMALLEVNNRVQSTIMGSLINSLGNELSLLFKLFAEGMVGTTSFKDRLTGKELHISKEDFDSSVEIIPVADPNLTTKTQRILQAEGGLRLASSAPELHNMHNAYYRVYESFGMEDIDEILPPPQEVHPLDPISENINALNNKPLKTGPWQDDEAHIISHQLMIEQYPETAPILNAHIAEHKGNQYRILMEEKIGMQLPPLEQILDPTLQNAIALESAKASMELKSQIIAQQPKQIDPQAVMMAEIEQRREAESMRMEIAKMKTELEAFKAQLKYESDKERIQSQEKIADMKSETDLVMTEAKLKVDLSKQSNTSKGEN